MNSEYGYCAYLDDRITPGFKCRYQAEQVVIDKAYGCLPRGVGFIVGESKEQYGFLCPVYRHGIYFYANTDNLHYPNPGPATIWHVYLTT